MTERTERIFGIDLGIGKRFALFTLKDQPHTLQFRAESFNITNSVRFDPFTANRYVGRISSSLARWTP